MSDIKKKIEALLFSSGRRMSIEELGNLLKIEPDALVSVLEDLREDYAKNDSALVVVNDGIYWKLTNKPNFLELVKKIVSKTELSKTLMETLAVIAFKYPIKQADLIKIRSNKAYDHLKELEDLGYISRQKHGRSKLIKLTERFFDYFDLKEENLKDQFRDFESIASKIEEKEEQIKEIREEQKKKAKEEAKKKKEIDLVDEEGHNVELDVVDVPNVPEEQKPNVLDVHSKIEKEKVDGMEVYEKPKEEVLKEESEEGPVEDVQAPEEAVDDRVSDVFGYYDQEVSGKEEIEESKAQKEDQTEEKKVETGLDEKQEDKSVEEVGPEPPVTEEKSGSESVESLISSELPKDKEEASAKKETTQQLESGQDVDDEIPIKDQPGAKDIMDEGEE